ncbi:MAG: nucleoside deaminase [Bacteroidales bacterium]|nr:nucleoside deaminase [Bacteroidales bacterium]
MILSELPTDDARFMAEALKEAKLAMQHNEIPVGAVVVFQGRIVARGHNLTEKLNDPTAHAEMIAITAATHAMGGKYLTGCTLYVTLEPCVMCAGALGWSQIGSVVYAASDPKRGFLAFAPKALHPKTILRQGPGGTEAANLMKSFFAVKR